MATVTIVREIQAPVGLVFDTVANPKAFAEVLEGVTSVEFLSQTIEGLGTRFRQSRTLGGRSTTMDFEVTEYRKGERIRIFNEIHGTVWDSLFLFSPTALGTTLTMRMDTRTRPLLPRLLMPVMIALFIKKAIEKDLDALKTFCEKTAVAGGQGRAAD